MPGMSRTALIIMLAGLAAGDGLGLYVGWAAAPAQYVDTAPNSLQRAFKHDYILMIATSYADGGDLPASPTQLAYLGFSDRTAAPNAAPPRMSPPALTHADK